MAIRLTTYDPAKVRVSIGGFLITGFASGSMIEYQLEAEVIRDAEGIDGEPLRWARNSPFATLQLMLMQSSDSNRVLGNFLNVDRLSMASIVPAMIEDKNGGNDPTRIISASAWIKEQPPLRWGSDPEIRTWILRLINNLHDIRGYNPTSVRSA